MELLFEFVKFMVFSLLIVAISKYALVPILRKLAEAMSLKPKTVGNVAGIATSMPELLSVGFAASAGLIGTSIFNILSSNVINLIQYLVAIVLNKNGKTLKNKALKIDLILVVITIAIPILLLLINRGTEIWLVPIFIILLLLCYRIDTNVHKLYLKHKEEKKTQEDSKPVVGKKAQMIKYALYLLVIGIALFFVGNLLSNSLESLCLQFNIPEFVMGIALGIITSLPELITFFESQKHHKKQENTELGVVEATNNLLTSNLLNLFVIQSVGIVIYTIIS